MVTWGANSGGGSDAYLADAFEYSKTLTKIGHISFFNIFPFYVSNS